MAKRAAIILAGGKGQRFQNAPDKWQDKALARLDGKTLIIHAIENVCHSVDEIIVVINENEQRKTDYQGLFAEYDIRKAKLVA